MGSSFETCTAQCLVACGKSSACTTAIVRDKVGGGRACQDGRLGQDDLGACVPAFGDVKDAWTYFNAHCAACGDSDACQAACKTIMERAPFVVDETRAHPDVCPSFDCPDCVGPCTSCSATDCVQACDARHAPTPHCVAGNAVSVQGLFEDRSLQDRTTAADKAMGTYYDNQCKSESVRRAHDYFAAFMQPLTRVAPPVRRPASAEAAYINERVRRAEQLRARQLDALGIGSSLRTSSSSSSSRRGPPPALPVPVTAPVPAVPAPIHAARAAPAGAHRRVPAQHAYVKRRMVQHREPKEQQQQQVPTVPARLGARRHAPAIGRTNTAPVAVQAHAAGRADHGNRPAKPTGQAQPPRPGTTTWPLFAKRR